jgi:hypothetical protein
MKTIKSLCTLAILLFAVNAFGQAQESGEYARFNDPFRVYLGGFYPTMSSKIGIKGTDVTPPPISVEDTLGVDDGEFVPWGGASWHISRRNSLEFEFFQLNRDGFIDVISDPIGVGDLIIESGSVNTAFDITVSRLTYGFSVARSERMDLQIKGGLHIADLSAGLQLMGAVCDITLGEMPPGCPADQTPALESEDVTAPLPHFGLSWAYAITPTIAADVRVIGFAIELDNIDGSLIEVAADIAWQPWQHFGIGVGFRYFDVNVEAGDSSLNGEFDLEYYGPSISVIASF